MRKIEFHMLRDNSDISREFGCSASDLNRLLNSDPCSHYHKMKILKKNHKFKHTYNQPQDVTKEAVTVLCCVNESTTRFRTVFKILNPSLELLQKNISTAIANNVEFPEYVQGFIRKRSIISNAKQHLAKKYIFSIDIKDFFESIPYDKVVLAFQNIGCNIDVAKSLSKICTLNNFLPQGASSSPIVANLVCKKLDSDLCCLGQKYSACYTRYADDITFSGDTFPQLAEIELILKSNDFSINNGKVRTMKRGHNQYVTGLTVFDSVSPRVPRKIKKTLRLILYYAKKFGIEEHLDRQSNNNSWLREYEKSRIEGWINFITSVEPTLGNKMKATWYSLL